MSTGQPSAISIDDHFLLLPCFHKGLQQQQHQNIVVAMWRPVFYVPPVDSGAIWPRTTRTARPAANFALIIKLKFIKIVVGDWLLGFCHQSAGAVGVLGWVAALRAFFRYLVDLWRNGRLCSAAANDWCRLLINWIKKNGDEWWLTGNCWLTVTC